MKKKTLVILLIIPFVIALLTFVSVVALTNNVGIDPRITWNYRENEGFKTNDEYKLEANLEYDPTQFLKPGSDTLVWEIQGESNPDVCKIESKDGGYYLKTGSTKGEATIICRTENKRVSLSMKAHIYDNGLVLINPVNQSSGSQIDPVRYYGEYDITYSDDLSESSLVRNEAKIPLEIEVFSDSGVPDYTVTSISDNISFDKANSTITIKKEGEAHLTLTSVNESYIENTYSFTVVDEGINVYSFNDLMMCTNKSTNGEVTVMQVNLESRENALVKDGENYKEEYKSSNTKLFGNYNFRNQSFNFNDFIYREKPKLPTKFIEQFMLSGSANENFNYQTEIKVGVHIQKDFYGNGFTINAHELAYPVHGEEKGVDPIAQKVMPDREKDYFFGPLTFVSIGDLENVPIIRAYLCDNAGFLLDGDNLTINDVKFQNANNINNMFNLSYTGTVLEVEGKNNAVKNSLIQNGRTCVRAFSTDGLLIDNCLLQNAGEFIVKLGSNKVNPTNHGKEVSVRYGGNTINKSFDEFFNGAADDTTSANGVLTSMITSSYSGGGLDSAMTTINDIKSGLDDLTGIENSDGTYNYDAHITINDTYFYNSGIYSIAFENSFNGAYIYNGMPSQLTEVFGALAGAGQNVVIPNDIGGTAYPVELTLSGDTRFYDWKNIDDIDISALIEENISAILNSFGGSLGSEFPQEIIDLIKSLKIDDYFPIKTLIKNNAIQNGYAYQENDEDGVEYYINRPVAWYGGGLNASRLVNNITQNDYYSYAEPLDIDFARETFSKAIGGLDTSDLAATFQTIINLLSRCIVMAIGSHPFQFMTNDQIINNEKPILFDEVPSYLDLSSRTVR